MSGGIIYGLVSRGTVVLAEYAKANGNFMQVCRLILQKLDTSLNTRASYAYDAYFFHYICENGLIYMCMTDATLRKTLAYMYLDDIKTRFTSKYGGYAADAPAYRFNDEFSRVLQTQSVHIWRGFAFLDFKLKNRVASCCAHTLVKKQGEILDQTYSSFAGPLCGRKRLNMVYFLYRYTGARIIAQIKSEPSEVR
jgi:hypothetical protein